MPDLDKLPELVRRWNDGEQDVLDDIVDLVYDDLRIIAHKHLKLERDDHTLSTTALVHEAYVKLSERTGSVWQGRAQFFALVSKVMRNLLIDYARRRTASRRGGSKIHVPLDEGRAGVDSELVELLSLDQALDQLEVRNARMARIVECRFFGGMPHAEIAEAIGVSLRTVERDWTRARAYLYTLLSDDEPSNSTAPA